MGGFVGARLVLQSGLDPLHPPAGGGARRRAARLCRRPDLPAPRKPLDGAGEPGPHPDHPRGRHQRAERHRWRQRLEPAGQGAVRRAGPLCWRVAVAVFYRLSVSWYGIAARAVREDPAVASSLGIAPRRIQTIAFVISGAVGGLGGMLLALVLQFLSPDTYFVNIAFTMIAAVVLGGSYHWIGAIIGAAVFTALPVLAQAIVPELPGGGQRRRAAADHDLPAARPGRSARDPPAPRQPQTPRARDESAGQALTHASGSRGVAAAAGGAGRRQEFRRRCRGRPTCR